MKANKQANLRWVMGLHAVEEALKTNPHWVSEVCIFEGKERELDSLVTLAQKKRLAVRSLGKKFFNDLGEGHQGIAISMTDRPHWQDGLADQDHSLVVFLDGITDPHNLGAILRSAWLLGVSGVFIPKNRRVDLTPVVCKVASGGAEHVPVESCHFQSQLEWFKQKGYWIYGLSEQGSVLLPQANPASKSVLVLGSEGAGLRSSTTNFCDQMLSIPQAPSGSSYNASVALALSVYEFRRSQWQ